MLLRAVAEKNEHMWSVSIETEEIEYAVFQAKPARCPKTCTKPRVTRSLIAKCVKNVCKMCTIPMKSLKKLLLNFYYKITLDILYTLRNYLVTLSWASIFQKGDLTHSTPKMPSVILRAKFSKKISYQVTQD